MKTGYGYLTSPNYPDIYQGQQRCSTQLGSVNTNITITFLEDAFNQTHICDNTLYFGNSSSILTTSCDLVLHALKYHGALTITVEASLKHRFIMQYYSKYIRFHPSSGSIHLYIYCLEGTSCHAHSTHYPYIALYISNSLPQYTPSIYCPAYR